jgi:hypothetical protein
MMMMIIIICTDTPNYLDAPGALQPIRRLPVVLSLMVDDSKCDRKARNMFFYFYNSYDCCECMT